MYSKFGHHPHPLGYLSAKFCFLAASIAELAHGEKSLNYSPSLFDALAMEVFALWQNETFHAVNCTGTDNQKQRNKTSHTQCLKKTAQNCFCQNFVKFPPITV